MRRALPLMIALWMALVPAGATASGGGLLGGAGSFTDPPYRYIALAPRTPHPLTVIERIDMRDSTIDRWWHLPGSYFLPAVANDGSAGGISANGALVLTAVARAYPPKRSRFAILDTRLFLSHPHRAAGAPRHAITHVSLPGAWGFDAISPDGSRIYLIHSFFKHRAVSRYEVRALDAASGRLLPQPIVDPEEPDERMEGSPVTRVSSRDGRWQYTLYTGSRKRFLHALDTVRGRAVCVDLPQLGDLREPFQLRLSLEDGGRTIVVHSRDTEDAGTAPLVEIDTRSFAVREPAAAALLDRLLSFF